MTLVFSEYRGDFLIHFFYFILNDIGIRETFREINTRVPAVVDISDRRLEFNLRLACGREEERFRSGPASGTRQ